jgi:predicted DNA-binding protein with PD1-like motif
MPYSSSIKAVTIRLKPGEDVKASLDNYAKEHYIKAACIITSVGSLTQATIRYANQPAAGTLIGKFEIISLTGTIAASGSHLHIAISDGTGKMTGGHLKEGSIVYTTAEIVIGVLPEVKFSRETDETYGFKELVVKHINMD